MDSLVDCGASGDGAHGGHQYMATGRWKDEPELFSVKFCNGMVESTVEVRGYNQVKRGLSTSEEE